LNGILEELRKWCIDCLSHWPGSCGSANKTISLVFKKMAALPSPTQVVLWFMFTCIWMCCW